MCLVGFAEGELLGLGGSFIQRGGVQATGPEREIAPTLVIESHRVDTAARELFRGGPTQMSGVAHVRHLALHGAHAAADVAAEAAIGGALHDVGAGGGHLRRAALAGLQLELLAPPSAVVARVELAVIGTARRELLGGARGEALRGRGGSGREQGRVDHRGPP